MYIQVYLCDLIADLLNVYTQPKNKGPLVDRWILWTSGLLSFFAGALYGWSALISPIQTAFTVTTSQAGLVFSWAIVSFTLGVIISPGSFKSLPPSLRLSGFGIIACLSLSLSVFVDSYFKFIILFSGGFGTMSGAIYITSVGIAANSKKYKISTPIMVAIFGAGGAVFGPMWRLLDKKGWGLDGLLILAAGLAAGSLLVGIGSWVTKPVIEVGRPKLFLFKWRQYLNLKFVLTWLVFAFGSFGGLMVLGLASKMMDVSGLSVGVVSLVLACLAIFNTLGRLSVAGFVQVIEVQNCIFIALALSMIGFLSIYLGIGLAIGLILISAGYGVIAATIPAVTRTVFGALVFQPIFAIMMTAWGFSGFFAPWISGIIFDNTGSFSGALFLASGMMVLCGLTTLMLNNLIKTTSKKSF